jgi:hypothetical protein
VTTEEAKKLKKMKKSQKAKKPKKKKIGKEKIAEEPKNGDKQYLCQTDNRVLLPLRPVL